MYSMVADVLYELNSILLFSKPWFINDQTDIGWQFAILRNLGMPRSERVTDLQEFRGKLHLMMCTLLPC